MTYPDPLAALGDPTRRTVLERLRDGPLAVVEIARGLPVSRPAVSQHLRVLREAGLVTERAEGTRRFYAIDKTGIAAARAYLDGLVAAGDTHRGDARTTGSGDGREVRPAAPRRRETASAERERESGAAAATGEPVDSSARPKAEGEAGGKKAKGKKGKRRGKSKG